MPQRQQSLTKDPPAAASSGKDAKPPGNEAAAAAAKDPGPKDSTLPLKEAWLTGGSASTSTLKNDAVASALPIKDQSPALASRPMASHPSKDRELDRVESEPLLDQKNTRGTHIEVLLAPSASGPGHVGEKELGSEVWNQKSASRKDVKGKDRHKERRAEELKKRTGSQHSESTELSQSETGRVRRV